MQFKVISALAFATLAAAAVNPPNTNSGKTDAGKPGSGKTDSGKTDSGKTSPANIAPPFSGNPPPTIGPSKCSTGHLQCCKSAGLPTDPAVAPHLTPLGISASTLSGYVGVACTTIPIVGAGPHSCSEKPLCCTDNSFSGVVSLGCNPVNLSL